MTAFKKIGALVRSMKFLSFEVALYYQFIIQPFMKYCCHVWAGALNCYLDMLDKLQKQVCGAISPSLVSPLETLPYRQYLASLSLFYRYF